MIYKNRKQLTCYVMINESDEVGFSELSSILMDRPANIVYCEKDKKLYGIISMGDIYRAYEAGKDYVIINRCFTSVKTNEYMHVRQIFRDNDKINALPVVDDFNKLMGDYSRWDDLIVVNDFEQFKSNKYAFYFWKANTRFALVEPCKEFVKKWELMQMWKDNLLQAGAQVEIVNREDIVRAFGFADYILFTDEDEKRGTEVLYRNICNRVRDWNAGKAKTYDSFRNVINDSIRNEIHASVSREVLKHILSSGVYVFTLECRDNKSSYWKMLQKDIADKYSQIGKSVSNTVHEEFKKEFFAEVYSEKYANEILSYNFEVIHEDGVSKLKNADRETYKVIDGERRTLAQPADFQRCIYFYGPCVIIGSKVADEHTIESFLQKRLNDKGYKIKCVNYGCISDQLTQLNRVRCTGLNKGDIVIFYNHYNKCEEIPNINLLDICEKHKVPAAWMTENPVHCNHRMNDIYADEIFKIIEPIIQKDMGEKESVELNNDSIALGYLERYFYGFAETHRGINGSIVMNCNPFTLGHRYLIEQALKQVDHLVIFVVEEDKSLFTFKERFAMVIEGTKDLENVTVVPSGNFILSQTTFPEYFLKIVDEDIVYNVEHDITLFAEQIAPKLNITYRFVGEELEDKVTHEYNEAMKRILPKYGINIVEIPRIKMGGGNNKRFIGSRENV